MKTYLKSIIATLVAAAMFTFASCGTKEDEPTVNPGNDQPTQLTSLEGTAWVGIYNDTYQGYPAVLTWNLDFTSATAGSLYLEVVVAGQNQQPTDIPFTYTFDGTNGTLNCGAMGQVSMVYSASANTITIDLPVGIEESNESLGGTTVFYPRGSENGGGDQGGDQGGGNQGGGNVEPGEYTEDFPAGTRWHATEESEYTSEEITLPMTLIYDLTFNNDHTANLVISVEVLGQVSEAQSIYTNWTFDNTDNTGTLVIQGAPLPFEYYPSTNTIHTGFSFSANGGDSSGSLDFTQVQ